MAREPLVRGPGLPDPDVGEPAHPHLRDQLSGAAHEFPGPFVRGRDGVSLGTGVYTVSGAGGEDSAVD